MPCRAGHIVLATAVVFVFSLFHCGVSAAPTPLQRTFALLDADGDATLTLAEARAVAHGLEACSQAPGDDRAGSGVWTPAQDALLARVSAGIDLYDVNGDGGVTLLELEEALQSLDGESVEPTTPTQLHLAGATDSAVVVMWVTGGHTAASVVQYGSAPSALSMTATGTQGTYHAGDFQNTSMGFHGYIHTVAISGLASHEAVYYRVGDGSTEGNASSHWSSIRAFTPSWASSKNPTRLAWIGDVGTIIPAGGKVAQQILAFHNDSNTGPLDSVVVVGDIAYAGIDFPTNHDEFEFVWDLWGALFDPLASRVPLMTAPGNHEAYFNFTAYKARFHMPSDQEGGGEGNLWFSYDVGNVHVTTFSTEHPYGPGSPQAAWIEQDLAKADANRDIRPWVVICGHRPMYCSDTFASSSSRPGAGEQRNLEPLLLKYNVDLMIAGHHHVYERTPPVHNGTVTGSGSVYTDPVDPVHITIGTGGAHYPEAWLPDQPAWSAARAIDYGFGLLTAWNATHLSYSFEPLTNETAADEMWIVRSNAPQ